MMLVTKLVDAATDPLMGAIADRTRSRWGRFRPWMLYGALPLAFAGVLTWTVPDLDGNGRLLWAYATFTLMMLAYTVLSMPYSALSGVMTADSQQRTTLISFRFIAAFAGTTVVNWLTLDLVRWLGRGDEALGWQLTLGLYGLVAIACFATVFLSTRERIEPPRHFAHLHERLANSNGSHAAASSFPSPWRTNTSSSDGWISVTSSAATRYRSRTSSRRGA